MKFNKLPYVMVSLCLLSYVVFFQNCTSNTNFGTTSSSNIVTDNDIDPKAPDIVGDQPAPLFNLSHVNGNRIVTINVTGISVTDSTCKLQFQKNGTIWTDFTDPFQCHSDMAEAPYTLPSLPVGAWTNNFNATGVSVRMVKSSDNSPVGSFSQKLICTAKPFSSNPTPNIDEDCNGIWDNVDLGARTDHLVPTDAKTLGSTYHCEHEVIVQGKNAVFKNHRWFYSSYLFPDSNCADFTYTGNSGPRQDYISNEKDGATTYMHVYSSSTAVCEASEGTNSLGQAVSGFSRHYSIWTTSHCVYDHYPNSKYY